MIDEFKNESNFAKKLYKQKRYFEVIMIGVQLLSNMADYISECLTGIANEDFDENDPEHRAWQKVSDIYHNTLRKIKGEEAPRAKVLGVFYDVVNNDGFQHYREREVVSLMHKVERVVSFRNDLSHCYFEKQQIIKRVLAVRAKECVDLIDELNNHPWIS